MNFTTRNKTVPLHVSERVKEKEIYNNIVSHLDKESWKSTREIANTLDSDIREIHDIMQIMHRLQEVEKKVDGDKVQTWMWRKN